MVCGCYIRGLVQCIKHDIPGISTAGSIRGKDMHQVFFGQKHVGGAELALGEVSEHAQLLVLLEEVVNGIPVLRDGVLPRKLLM
jgi:hypothetical protein